MGNEKGKYLFSFPSLQISTPMLIQPPTSRNTLQGESFEESETGYTLSLPPYYAEVFKNIEPDVFSKLKPLEVGFQYNKSFWLTKPSIDECKRIERFIKMHKRIVIISINKNISPHFTNELDSCTALEYIYNFDKQDKTHYGKMYNKAKYNQHEPSIKGLIDALSIVLRQLPYCTHVSEFFLTYVPPFSGKIFYLPKILVHGVASKINSSKDKLKCHVLDTWLNINKPEFKRLTIQEKYETWQDLYKSHVSRQTDQTEWHPTIVIEDSYQSGTTIWSYAKYLKTLGSPEVHGLCCVKLMRDTDNQ